MSLLEEIQTAAVDGTTDLGTLLRKCKVLGARLGSVQLENWLLWESNGYPENVPVPGYRIWPLELKGVFSGPFRSTAQLPIPLLCVPEKARKQYENYECRESVAAIEAILKTGQANLQISTGDLALALQTDVYTGHNCVQAWAEVGSGHLVELLNVVRNRILDFALAIWKESPSAGEANAAAKDSQLSPSRLTQIFNTTITGGSANVIAATNSSVNVNIVRNDFHSLEEVLLELGVSAADVAELRKAVDTDIPPKSKGAFGPHVSGWITKMIGKAADGTWNVGIAVGAEVIYHAIAKYYGIA